MIPLMIDLSARSVVIFGGGEVSARKAAFFCREARVRVVSRSFLSAFDALPVERTIADLEGMPEESVKEMLSGAFLAVAATSDPEINNRIGRYCGEEGILFNNADGETGDVLVPSAIRGERYLIAITTFGRAPAISRFIREYLEHQLPGLDAMVGLQEELRRELRGSEPSSDRRAALLWQVLRDAEVWESAEQGVEEAGRVARRKYLHG